MKTTIEITGQPMGNFTLRNAISTIDCETKKHFHNFSITFRTKKAAVDALSGAYQSLKFDEPDYAKEGGISYMRGYSLQYDASKAVVC